LTRQSNERGSPINFGNESVFNVKVSYWDGTPLSNGNFYLIWRNNHFSKAEILIPTLFSCTAITAMKYSGTMSIGRCSSSALCAERGVCTGLGEHMDQGGGGFEKLYIRQGLLASTSFISFK
jgi:hypothetical protein